MINFNSIDDVLNFAIAEEQAAIDLYTLLAEKAVNPAVRKTFEDFIQEETRHRDKLTQMKEGKKFTLQPSEVQEMKISDYTLAIKPSPDMTYADALLYAMNKEKAAFKLYTHLAARTKAPELKKIFLLLAQEESNHKLHFEIEYDDHVLNED